MREGGATRRARDLKMSSTVLVSCVSSPLFPSGLAITRADFGLLHFHTFYLLEISRFLFLLRFIRFQAIVVCFCLFFSRLSYSHQLFVDEKRTIYRCTSYIIFLLLIFIILYSFVHYIRYFFHWIRVPSGSSWR